MTKPKLSYFDAPVSRGEECRLALHLAGVDFEDNRLSRDAWMALKPTTPFGQVPVLEMPGQPPLAQSNAILTFVGRRHGLHPKDDFEAARHEAMMAHVEDLRALVTATTRIPDEGERKRAREALAATGIPTWAAAAEAQIAANGPFFAGEAIHVVDLKLLLAVRMFRRATFDHVPPTVLAPYPKLNRVHDAVDAHPAVRAWTARHA